MLRTVLLEILNNYLEEKSKPYAQNTLALNIRREYPTIIRNLLRLGDRYLVQGSCGQGQWAHCPWLAILDKTLTTTVQKEYYIVFLFKTDMSGIYLSLNQGITTVKENYHSQTRAVLRTRAEDFRSKIVHSPSYLDRIQLGPSALSNDLSRFYEEANIIACYYALHNLPPEELLLHDLYQFMKIYQDLVYEDRTLNIEPRNDEVSVSVEEQKRIRFHARIDRNAWITNKVKQYKGCRCEACGLSFEEMYGSVGRDFIEVHHMIPISTLDEHKTQIDIETGFAVLCSNCHRMIHKLQDTSDLEGLRTLIRSCLL